MRPRGPHSIALVMGALLVASAGPALTRGPDCDGLDGRRPTDPYSADCQLALGMTTDQVFAARDRLNAWIAADPEDGWSEAALAGLTHDRRVHDAEAPIQRALSIFVGKGDAKGEAYVRAILARQRYVYGRAEEARAELDRARELERRAPDPTTRVWIASGDAHLLSRESREEDMVTLARETMRDQTFAGASADSRAVLVSILEAALALLGRYSEALQAAQQSRDICGPATACECTWYRDRADVLVRMGLSGLVGRADVAEAFEREYETTAAAGLGIDVVEALCKIGDWLPPSAGARWDQRCIDEARQHHCETLAVNAMWRQSTLLARQDHAHLDEARRIAEHALVASRASGQLVDELNSYGQLADIQSIAGDEAGAAQSLGRAVDLVDSAWGRSADPDDRFDIMSNQGLYYYCLGWLQASGKQVSPLGVARSFDTMERLRARTYATSLGRSDVTTSDDAELTAARAAIAQTQRRLGDATLSPGDRADLQDLLEGQELRESALVEARAHASASWAELNRPLAATLAEAQAALDPDQALLQFQLPAMDEPPPWVNVITKDSAWSVPLDATEVQRLQRLYVGMIQRRDDSARAAGARLAQALFKDPLARLSGTIRRLVIVPDGAMFGIPLDTLPDPRTGLPLVASFDLTLAPSATSWTRLRAQTPHALHAAVLGVAEPAASRDTARRANERGWMFQTAPLALPRTADEVADVVGWLGGSSRALSGGDASESTLKRLDLAPFGIIHFATHAIASRERPARSAVLLAPGGRDEDGLLQPREIAQLDLRGKLVVLSACDSADGSLIHGEGPLSLARAFLHSGATAVIGTLWPVQDDEAATLMDAFYRRLAAGRTVAAALSETQAQAAADGSPAAAWAAYVVIGDGSVSLDAVPPPRRPRPRAKPDGGVIAVTVAVLSVLLVALALLLRAIPRKS